jgi:hypothetical protein
MNLNRELIASSKQIPSMKDTQAWDPQINELMSNPERRPRPPAQALPISARVLAGPRSLIPYLHYEEIFDEEIYAEEIMEVEIKPSRKRVRAKKSEPIDD